PWSRVSVPWGRGCPGDVPGGSADGGKTVGIRAGHAGPAPCPPPGADRFRPPSRVGCGGLAEPRRPRPRPRPHRGAFPVTVVLSRRALNRATLARQHLGARVRMPAVAMAEHLVGMQAQAPWPPYTGLWTRIEGFRYEELVAALTGRRLVRVLLHRGTVHLVSAADCLALRPLLRPVLLRGHRAEVRAAFADEERIARLTREVLDARGPLTPAELGAALAERLSETPAKVLADVARMAFFLLQVPPRAVWGAGGATRYATARSWLGAEGRAAGLPELVRRYLTAFGPATVADVQAWCGLTRLREVTDAMPDLSRSRGEDGTALLDVPGAPRPGPGAPAPVRFLAEFDNVLLYLRRPQPHRAPGGPAAPLLEERPRPRHRAARRVRGGGVAGGEGDRHGDAAARAHGRRAERGRGGGDAARGVPGRAGRRTACGSRGGV
ncbi:LOW QUALITY PROTEIN: conserved hypothetical protein, partial [Streptomyces sp. SPB074]